MNKVVIGSRGSNLALRQSESVKEELLKKYPDLNIEIKVIHTKGDCILDRPLNQIGDKGLFTQEIEQQLLEGQIDLAVHSMKDMPSYLPNGLVFAGTIAPEDARDCLVFHPQKGYHSLYDLPRHAIVGTGSIRRRVQILKLRPDLRCVDIRGNIETRLKKMESENMDAIILASAGLHRLHLEKLIGQYLSYDEMIPACNQGVLAIETRKDSQILKLLKSIENSKATRYMKMIRLYQETVGGNCHMPIGCHIEEYQDQLLLRAIYGTQDGQVIVTSKNQVRNLEEVKSIALKLKEKVENHG